MSYRTLKAAQGGTVFSGYASLFGQKDQSGDIVVRGAFRTSLARRGPKGVRMLFQHDPGEPIGTWLELREDRNGLFVKGRLPPHVARARELAGLIRDGGIDGLSIGFRTRRARHDRATGTRRLLAVDLWEISLVTFPMLASARIHPNSLTQKGIR